MSIPLVQKSVLDKIENRNEKETDLVLAQELNLKIIENEKKKTQKGESVRIELTFSKEEMELIEKARALLSHKTGGNS